MIPIKKLEERLGYSFQQSNLLKLALTHPSSGEQNNQRLEYLGDAVLELCISDLLFHLHPHYPEGRLTRLRAFLVCKATLLQVAKALSLQHHVVSQPPLSAEARGRSGILADAVEAVLAAIYLDGGLTAAMTFVRLHWAQALAMEDNETSAKSELQEYYQTQYQRDLTYRTLEETGPAHAREFLSAVYDGETELGRGKGRSKKQAEQAAAAMALKSTQGAKRHEA